jgi:D-alanyl-lipoteichoic acid acyltransferase DltB (MBOAT superfamily)
MQPDSNIIPALPRWVLSFMWLKFTVVWRFFRLASLAAGVDAPENIRRCFANNYDIEVWRPAAECFTTGLPMPA